MDAKRQPEIALESICTFKNALNSVKEKTRPEFGGCENPARNGPGNHLDSLK
jgi:hypothetical protein